jgi:glycosyl transferase family 2
MSHSVVRRAAKAALAPLERRLAATVGRLISEKVAYFGLDQVTATLVRLQEQQLRLERQLRDMERTEELMSSGLDGISESLGRTTAVLQMLYDDEPGNRRRLWELRGSPDYAASFDESDPLVSVVIPTYDNTAALRERSIPSVLAQTYENFEVVVVGDAAPPATDELMASLGDSRLRFLNLERRGPYPDDPHKLWLTGGTPPYNTAVRLAKGRWIAYLSDDDSFRPDHLERLVREAQARRLEMCYGLFVHHAGDGTQTVVGKFPPELGHFGFQAAIYHAGLRFMEFELADAEFDQPVDWGLCRRMLRAGVRIGMVDEPTTDYFPSWDWGGRKERHAEHESLKVRETRSQ